jgi:hypothetical protein
VTIRRKSTDMTTAATRRDRNCALLTRSCVSTASGVGFNRRTASGTPGRRGPQPLAVRISALLGPFELRRIFRHAKKFAGTEDSVFAVVILARRIRG